MATEAVHVTDDLAGALQLERRGRAVVLLGDPRTLEACGHDLAERLDDADIATTVRNLELSGTPLHAADADVQRTIDVLEEGDPHALAISVGSGTVNDLVKCACHALARPYLCVATAASMNGYTSAIAAITVRGLKSTLPSAPPRAVLASPRVLAASPVRLSLSGLADLLSKPVSSADWQLAHLLWDEPWCATPGALASDAVEQAVAAAPGLPRRDEAAVTALLEALLLSGISMAVAGTSSPASGGEHLVSHYLDMLADAGRRTHTALHGEQVGVATRGTTRLYRTLLARSERDIDWAAAAERAPDESSMRARLDAEPDLPPVLRTRFLEQGCAKLRRLPPARERVAHIRERWETIRAALGPGLDASRGHDEVLSSVGAPTTAPDLGVSADDMRAAFRLGRWVRDRYTILDLVDDTGLREELAPEALRGIC